VYQTVDYLTETVFGAKGEALQKFTVGSEIQLLISRAYRTTAGRTFEVGRRRGACQNYGEEKLKLEVEHGVDASARGLNRRLSALKRRKRSLLGGWRRSRRLLHGRLRRGGRGSRRSGSCDSRGSSGRLGSKLLEIGEIARLFRARLNGGK
jgi:hypothetical protein